MGYRPPLHPLARLALARVLALAESGAPRAAAQAPRVLAALPRRALPDLERVRLACALEMLAAPAPLDSLAVARPRAVRAVRDALAECARLADLYARHARDAGLADALAQRWARDRAREGVRISPAGNR